MIKTWLLLLLIGTSMTTITQCTDNEQTEYLQSIFKNLGMYFPSRNLDSETLILLAKNSSVLQEYLSSMKLSSPCMFTIDSFFNNLSHLLNDTKKLSHFIETSQILYYLDAWPKLPSRILFGNTGWYGAFDECQSISSAHYCLADMTLHFGPKQISGYYGTCVPKNCSREDVFKILSMTKQYIGSFIDFPSKGSLAAIGGPVLCNDKHSLPKDTIAFIVLFSILCLLCILGTIIEGLQDCLTPDRLIPPKSITGDIDGFEEDKSSFSTNSSISYRSLASDGLERTRGNLFMNFLMCFSVFKNSHSIMTTDVGSTVVRSVNGIRAISMFWVILGHIFFFAVYVKVDNIKIAEDILQRFSYQAIANAYVSVDSFFLLSGFLVAFVSLKKMDNSNGKINILMYYLHRFIRLTPSYMFSIFIYTSIYPQIVESPLGIVLKNQGVTNCHKYWWTNLLYINNFYPTKFSEECLGWSWYLANDMQFYIISPLFLFIMYRFRLRGTLISILAGIVICVTSTAVIIGVNKYPALISEAWSPKAQQNPDIQKKVFASATATYIRPYTRIAPYLVGLLLGYVLSKKIYITAKPNLFLGLMGWLLATGIGMAVIYGPYTVFMKNGDVFTQTENIMYASLSRLGWALALAWVIYACHHKMGGIINKILCWNVWIPLSRLTYGAYLLHPIVLMYYYNSLQNPLHYQDVTTIFRFLSVLVVSYTLAFAMALLVDVPVFNIEKLITKKLSKHKL